MPLSEAIRKELEERAPDYVAAFEEIAARLDAAEQEREQLRRENAQLHEAATRLPARVPTPQSLGADDLAILLQHNALRTGANDGPAAIVDRPTKRYRPTSRRMKVFQRDGYTCRYCGARPPEAVLTLDHVLPLAHGGTDAIANLVTACRECNLGKGTDLTIVPPGWGEVEP